MGMGDRRGWWGVSRGHQSTCPAMPAPASAACPVSSNYTPFLTVFLGKGLLLCMHTCVEVSVLALPWDQGSHVPTVQRLQQGWVCK